MASASTTAAATSITAPPPIQTRLRSRLLQNPPSHTLPVGTAIFHVSCRYSPIASNITTALKSASRPPRWICDRLVKKAWRDNRSSARISCIS